MKLAGVCVVLISGLLIAACQIGQDSSQSSDPANSYQIAYSSGEDGSYNIHIVDVDSGTVRQLTDSISHDWNPAWSPDGSQIAFARENSIHSGDQDIFVIDADGNVSACISLPQRDGCGQPRPLTSGPDDDWGPVWSPDGTRILFTRQAQDPQSWRSIHLMDADGGNIRRLTSGATSGKAHENNPEWSPDGKHITFTRASASYIIDADGNNLGLLTLIRQAHSMDKWSPSGNFVTLRVARGESAQDIYLATTSGSGGYRKLTDGDASHGSASWSPDGGKIAIGRTRASVHDEDVWGAGDIVVVNANGSNTEQLTSTFADEGDPMWAPDGGMIAFQRKQCGVSDIFIMDADGTNVRQLTDSGGEALNHVWSPVPRPRLSPGPNEKSQAVDADQLPGSAAKPELTEWLDYWCELEQYNDAYRRGRGALNRRVHESDSGPEDFVDEFSDLRRAFANSGPLDFARRLLPRFAEVRLMNNEIIAYYELALEYQDTYLRYLGHTPPKASWTEVQEIRVRTEKAKRHLLDAVEDLKAEYGL